MTVTHELAPLGVKTAVAIGYFDGFHLGHQSVLRTALAEAEAYSLQPALLSFDMSALRAEGKGGADLFPPQRKQRWAEEMGFSHYIEAPFGDICGMTAAEFVENVLTHRCLGAAVVVCGDDFRFGKGRSGDVKTLQKLCGPHGIRVIPAASIQLDGVPVSTTRIKKLVEEGNMPAAAKLLGRSYDILGEVIHGNSMGHRMGFPTANVALAANTVLPRRGVYLSQALVQGVWRRAITNIGTRPTVTADEQPVSETHIVDFEGDLYGKQLQVRLLRFLRPEQKFASADQLQETVLQNVETARTTLIDERVQR
ncbi:MAG: riboflavin biosynthesis protein RibF [Oscillospiraceae bacterium]|nr:riboflavin biosynthesis protein RibF [Oscillospiraceae bacterium]MBQ9959070.1 riboflavin biosynthesis protein RibF [Oscillospiraceae bacterium]